MSREPLLRLRRLVNDRECGKRSRAGFCRMILSRSLQSTPWSHTFERAKFRLFWVQKRWSFCQVVSLIESWQRCFAVSIWRRKWTSRNWSCVRDRRRDKAAIDWCDGRKARGDWQRSGIGQAVGGSYKCSAWRWRRWWWRSRQKSACNCYSKQWPINCYWNAESKSTSRLAIWRWLCERPRIWFIFMGKWSHGSTDVASPCFWHQVRVSSPST